MRFQDSNISKLSDPYQSCIYPSSLFWYRDIRIPLSHTRSHHADHLDSLIRDNSDTWIYECQRYGDRRLDISLLFHLFSCHLYPHRTWKTALDDVREYRDRALQCDREYPCHPSLFIHRIRARDTHLTDIPGDLDVVSRTQRSHSQEYLPEMSLNSHPRTHCLTLRICYLNTLSFY